MASKTGLAELFVLRLLQPLGWVIYLKSAQTSVFVQSSLEGADRRSVDCSRHQRIPIIDDAYAERISSDSGDGPWTLDVVAAE